MVATCRNLASNYAKTQKKESKTMSITVRYSADQHRLSYPQITLLGNKTDWKIDGLTP
jgi:hypothetical protein